MKKLIISMAVVVSMVLSSSAVFADTYSTYPPRGTIKGAYVDYVDADYIAIKTGYGECNGKYWEVTSDITYQLTGITGPDFYYIYIDDSQAAYPNLDNDSFAHADTEPVWSDTKFGWYNGNDRCIGAVWVNDSHDILSFLAVNSSDKTVDTYANTIKILIDTTSISSSFQTLTDSSTYVPVNATEVRLSVYVDDDGAPCNIWVTPAERVISAAGLRLSSYRYANTTVWMPLDDSRDIAWQASADDRRAQIINMGFKISR